MSKKVIRALNPNTGTTWGTDPEAFFKRNGNIIGSEKLIPKAGLKFGNAQIVRDGVQCELHPAPSPNLADVKFGLSQLLVALQERARGYDALISFDGLVEVSREELESLSPENKILGCMPSVNVYKDRIIDVDPIAYRKRSSGGHIHFGLSSDALKEAAREIVPLCDILVGNTTVLLDRDPGAAERRQNYGRVGECRFPKHGLEYRTTSNFWLRDPVLMDFTFGMANLAVALMQERLNDNFEPWNGLARYVEINSIMDAVDGNNFKLALKNFRKLVPFLRAYLPLQGFPLTPATIPAFINLANRVNKHGIERYFPEHTIFNNWRNNHASRFTSWLVRNSA